VSLSLTGKTAIVTGGATLISDKVVEAMVDAGANVVSADVNHEEGRRRAAAYDDRVVFSATDVTDDGQLDDLVRLCTDTFGGIDILVNAAATYLDDGLETSRDDWLAALDVNLVSGAILTAKVASHMERRGGGSIINFASTSGKRATHFSFVYAASKAAILGITRSEAVKLADKGIRVNSVSPAWVWSNPIDKMSGDGGYTALGPGAMDQFHRDRLHVSDD